MRRVLTAIGAVMGLAALTACDAVLDVRDLHVDGSGRVVSEARAVHGFSGVVLSGIGRLIIEQDGREHLTITAEDNILPHLTAEMRGGQLILGTASGISISPRRTIEYHVSARFIESITVSGSAEVEAWELDGEYLSIVLSGAGQIFTSGFVTEQHVSLSGAGHYDGADLTTRIAAVGVSGSGYAVVRVRDELHADVSGSGLVEYLGRPAVFGTVSGSGVVRWRGP